MMVKIFCVIPALFFPSVAVSSCWVFFSSPTLCLRGLCSWASHICAPTLRAAEVISRTAVGSQRGNSDPLGLHWGCLSQSTTGARAACVELHPNYNFLAVDPL